MACTRSMRVRLPMAVVWTLGANDGLRIPRGGSWYGRPRWCALGYPAPGTSPSFASTAAGFRVARLLPLKRALNSCFY